MPFAFIEKGKKTVFDIFFYIMDLSINRFMCAADIRHTKYVLPT